MFAQIQLVVLVALVTGSLSAPGIYRVGFTHNLEGDTDLKAGARAKGTLKDGVADGKGQGHLGISGSGTAGGGVFVQNNDHIVEAAGDYHGSAGAYIRPSITGTLGKNSNNGKYVSGVGTDLGSGGKHSGSGSAGIYTNEDALGDFNKHHNLKADDVLSVLEDYDF